MVLIIRWSIASSDSWSTSVSIVESFGKNILLDWGVKYHNLVFGKPNADIYIDDKGKEKEIKNQVLHQLKLS